MIADKTIFTFPVNPHQRKTALFERKYIECWKPQFKWKEQGETVPKIALFPLHLHFSFLTGTFTACSLPRGAKPPGEEHTVSVLLQY